MLRLLLGRLAGFVKAFGLSTPKLSNARVPQMSFDTWTALIWYSTWANYIEERLVCLTRISSQSNSTPTQNRELSCHSIFVQDSGSEHDAAFTFQPLLRSGYHCETRPSENTSTAHHHTHLTPHIQYITLPPFIITPFTILFQGILKHSTFIFTLL